MLSFCVQPPFGHQRDWVWRGSQIRYTYLRATESDSGIPIILLHGFGASIEHWQQNLPEFAKHHTVYALDMLGYGASEKVIAPYDAELWAEQAYDFWQTFVGKPAILIGNSLGSLVGLTATAMHPEIAQALVMINLPDSSVLESSAWTKLLIKGLGLLLSPGLTVMGSVLTAPIIFNPFFRWLRTPSVVKLWAKQAYANPAVVTSERVAMFSAPAFDRGAAAALRAMVTFKRRSPKQYTAKNVLPKLAMPMLLLWGKQDKMVPPKLGPLFTKYNPNLTLVEIDNAGHCPHDECPEIVNSLILDWLAAQKRESWDPVSP